jgi:hypothetical protein
MKKTYSKPTLVGRGSLPAVTAGGGPGIIVSLGPTIE